MARYVVTGAAGFIGSTLTEALLARGDGVVGIDCFTPYYGREHKERNLRAASSSSGFELVELDLRAADADRLAELVSGAAAVFHLAAQAGVRASWADGFDDYVGHNVLGTQRVLEAMARAGGSGRRLVYASSSSVYGEVHGPVHEEALPAPASPYGVTKLAAEHLCRLYASTHGVATVSLRYFSVYGPRQRPDMAVHRAVAAACGGGPAFPRYGDGTAVRDLTYVDDVVAATLLAAEAGVEPGTVLNVAGGVQVSLRSLLDAVGSAAGADVPVVAEGPQRGDVARTSGVTDRARSLLGWRPRTSLADGVAATVEWYRREVAG